MIKFYNFFISFLILQFFYNNRITHLCNVLKHFIYCHLGKSSSPGRHFAGFSLKCASDEVRA